MSRKNITVETKDGPFEVPAYVDDAMFAVHRGVIKNEAGENELSKKSWTITHLPTKRAFCRGFERKKDATEAIKNLRQVLSFGVQKKILIMVPGTIPDEAFVVLKYLRACAIQADWADEILEGLKVEESQ